ncbi:hypothetical protein HII36_17585 [Nonomuraea sp. NN258]|uniref:hypothetical protein n=1 Tax=Nonomuraea antri TaxID=2730852 RepID=UPI0015687EB1|nr:hypothetical protein [Nonomuraea antri]NRQ33648.1 hypothetical protein [Nonomuraea antri]
MRISFVPGAAGITINANPMLDEPFLASFDGILPDVRATADHVTVDFPRSFHPDSTGYGGKVTLNATLPWAIEVRGGAARLDADLRVLPLTRLDLQGGADRVRVDLPAPAGELVIHLAGGVSLSDFRRRPGVPARLTVVGGSTRLRLGERAVVAAPPGTVLTDPGFDEAADRYDIRVSGGADRLTVD